MCELTTALMAAAVATSVGGSIAGGIQQRSMANANARIASAEAAREEQLGQLRESTVRREYRQAAGLQRSQLAASGVTLDSLTSLDLGRDLGTQGFMDAQQSRLDTGARSTNLRNEARLSRAEGGMRLMGGFTSAATTALTAAPRLWAGLGS